MEFVNATLPASIWMRLNGFGSRHVKEGIAATSASPAKIILEFQMTLNALRSFLLLLLCFGGLLSPSDAQAADGWKNRPYLNLGGGSGFANIQTGDGDEWALLLGSEGGFRYSQRDGSLEGRTRVAGKGMGVLGGWGSETRAGTFLGLRRMLIGIEIGVDVFKNDYIGKEVALVESFGVDVPLSLKLGPKLLQGVATISPAFLMDPERRVDWSTTSRPGFGDEMEWSLGVEVGLPIVGVSLTYKERMVADAQIRSLQFGLEL